MSNFYVPFQNIEILAMNRHGIKEVLAFIFKMILKSFFLYILL